MMDSQTGASCQGFPWLIIHGSTATLGMDGERPFIVNGAQGRKLSTPLLLAINSASLTCRRMPSPRRQSASWSA
jgi:hypothetical protein